MNSLTSDARDGGDKVIQSVDRALAILEAMARQKGEVTLSEIAERVDLNVSTCHHLVRTLMARNYVRAGTARGRYMLGAQLVVLADAVNIKAELPGRAKPVLDALNRSTEEAVHLAVYEGGEMITLIKREARHALRVDNGSIGKSRALHATATGKILLSGMTEAQVREVVVRHGMEKYTTNTRTDLGVLLSELEQIRETGLSEDREEFQLYVVCLGAAVRDTTGRIIASISVSTPINRATEEHLARVREEVLAAGRALSLNPIATSQGPNP